MSHLSPPDGQDPVQGYPTIYTGSRRGSAIRPGLRGARRAVGAGSVVPHSIASGAWER